MATNIIIKGHVYQSIALPFNFNDSGNIALTRDRLLVEQDIISWIETLINEPFMEPDDGVGFDAQLFDPNDETTHLILANWLKTRLDELENRANILDVSIKQSTEPGESGIVNIVIKYKIPALSRGNNVYQFRLQRGEQRAGR